MRSSRSFAISTRKGCAVISDSDLVGRSRRGGGYAPGLDSGRRAATTSMTANSVFSDEDARALGVLVVDDRRRSDCRRLARPRTRHGVRRHKRRGRPDRRTRSAARSAAAPVVMSSSSRAPRPRSHRARGTADPALRATRGPIWCRYLTPHAPAPRLGRCRRCVRGIHRLPGGCGKASRARELGPSDQEYQPSCPPACPRIRNLAGARDIRATLPQMASFGSRAVRAARRRRAPADRCVVACRQLPLRRSDLPARQSAAARAAGRRARQAAAARALGHDARP